MTLDQSPSTDLPAELETRMYDILLMENAGEREALLRDFLVENAEHQEELTAVIEHFRGAEKLLESTGSTASVGQLERVGPYRIIHKLGSGGFGVVYLAEQEKPVRRKVALKLIAPGMDSQRVLRRFDAERQALALMNHSGIANVLDAGEITPTLSYFAMEYVDGVPITRACDLRSLDIESRLRLFCDVCAAVQHAHRQGIIHRDLKSSNILAMDQDGRLVSKVIDFGIAKALDRQLSDTAIATEEGRFLGTPEYMSPEQASGGTLDVRTDVYALSVLLYELITGQLPHASEELRRGAIVDTVRIICDTEVTRPSESLRRDPKAAVVAAECRSLDVSQLRRKVRGELETIIMKGLRKDPEERYDSVAHLAEDVNRYLSHEAVLAHPPAFTYEVRKFIRRHRIGVGVTVAGLLAGVLALVGTSWALFEIGVARDQAVRRGDEAENNAYAANTAAAKAAITSGDATAARRHLGATPVHLRGWEYDYLRAQCDHSVRVIDRLVASRTGDWGGVRDLALTADGAILVLTTYDGSIEIWDLSRDVLTSSVPAVDCTRILALHPSGESFATATETGTVEVWSLPGGERQSVLRIGGPTLHSIAYSSTGSLAFGDQSGVIHVVSPGSQGVSYELRGHGSLVSDVAFDADGMNLVSTEAHGPARIWSLRERCAIHTLETDTGKSCAFSPDGERVVIAGSWDGKLSVFDRKGALEWRTRSRIKFMGVSFDRTGDLVLVVGGYASSQVAAWAAEDGRTVGVWHGHSRGVEALALDPSGDGFLTGSRDGTIRYWSLQPPRAVDVFSHGSYYLTCAIDRQLGRVVTGADTGELKTWDVESGQAVRTVKADLSIRDMTFGPDGGPLYVAGDRVVVQVRDPENFDLLRSVRVEDVQSILKIAVDRLGKTIAIASFDGEIVLLDTASLKTRHLVSGRVPGTALAFHPRRDVFVVCSPDGFAELFDVRTAKAIERISIGGGGTIQCEFSPDGGLLACAGNDGTVRIVDIEARTRRYVLNAGTSLVRGCTFAPDGRRLASSHMDGSVRVWDLRSGFLVLALDGSMDKIAFGPSGRRLFACPAYDAPAASGRGLYVWHAPRAGR